MIYISRILHVTAVSVIYISRTLLYGRSTLHLTDVIVVYISRILHVTDVIVIYISRTLF